MMRGREPWEWALLGGLALLCGAVVALGLFLVNRAEWRIAIDSEIAAPPSRVFELLTTREGRLSWEPDLIDVAPLTGIAGTAGSTQLLYLRRDRDHWQIEERWGTVLPGRRLEIVRDGGTALVRLAVTLRAQAQGTTLLWRENRYYEGWQARLLAPLDLIDRRARLKAGLVRLAEVAERG